MSLSVFQRGKIVRWHDIGDVDAFAVNIEFPAMVDAADSALFIAAEKQRRQAVRAIGSEQT